MEPILDETSLVPCRVRSVGERIFALAKTLQALDRVGAPRVLRSVQDAATRDIADGNGLAHWCFQPATDRDSGRLVAQRLGKQPFIDGHSGLFASAEGARAVEARLAAAEALGVGLAALTDSVVVVLPSHTRCVGGMLNVSLTSLHEEALETEQALVLALASAEEVDAQRATLRERIDRTVSSGEALLGRLNEILPRIVLGPRAVDQIGAMNGSEQTFRPMLRHLRLLDECAEAWRENQFDPAVPYSVESSSTLGHGSFGPMRDFPSPDGFEGERWSLHTKLAGGARLYFRPVRQGTSGLVLVGYFGAHLPTVTGPG